LATIDGEAVFCDATGLSIFDELHNPAAWPSTSCPSACAAPSAQLENPDLLRHPEPSERQKAAR
jgi:hypothetical protein